MGLSTELSNELNEQMNREFESAYLYLQMAVYFEEKNLSGMAFWMRSQYDEEREHALKFFDFILERNSTPVLETFQKPKNKWESPLNAFEDAYDHEKYISKSIDDLMEKALIEKDYATKVFLDWFISEQVEEESTVLAIVEQLKMIKDSPSAMFLLNGELGRRITAQE